MSGVNYQTSEFAITVPAGWTCKALWQFIDPSPAPVPRSLVLSQDFQAKPVPLEQFVAQQQKELADTLTDYAVQEESSVAAGQLEVPVVGYTWSPQKGKVVKQYQGFFVKEPNLTWVLTATAAVEEAGVIWPMFQAAIQSLGASLSQ